MKTTITTSYRLITFTRDLTYPSGETVTLKVYLGIFDNQNFELTDYPYLKFNTIGRKEDDLLYTKEALLLIQEAINFAEKEVSNKTS